MSHTFCPSFATVTATATVTYNAAGTPVDNGECYRPMTSVRTGHTVSSSSRAETAPQGEAESDAATKLSPLSLSSGTLGDSDFSWPPPAESSSTMSIPPQQHPQYGADLGIHASQQSEQCFTSSLLVGATPTVGFCQDVMDDSNADGAGGWMGTHHQQGDYYGGHSYCTTTNVHEPVYPADIAGWHELDCYPPGDQGLGYSLHRQQTDFSGQYGFPDHPATMTHDYDPMHGDDPSFIPEHMDFLQAKSHCAFTNPDAQSSDLSSYGPQDWASLLDNTVSQSFHAFNPLQQTSTRCSKWYETDLDESGDPLSNSSSVSFLRNRNEDRREGMKEGQTKFSHDTDKCNNNKNCSTTQTQTYATCGSEIQTCNSGDTTLNTTEMMAAADVSMTNTGDKSVMFPTVEASSCSGTAADTEHLPSPQRAEHRACGQLQANTSPAVGQCAAYDTPDYTYTNSVAIAFCSTDQQTVTPTFSCQQPPPTPLSNESSTCQAQSRQASTSQALVSTASQHAEACHTQTSPSPVQTNDSSCRYSTGTEVIHDESSLSSSSPGSTPLIDVDHLLSSGVTVAGFKPRPIIRKRRKTVQSVADRQVMMPTTQKDGSYWHKRKKNNDSAKRSREAKKEKEKNFYRRALELEYENYFLKERLGQLETQLHAVTGVAPTPLDYGVPPAVVDGVTTQWGDPHTS